MYSELNLTMSYNYTTRMNTTQFTRMDTDYIFDDVDKILKMNGRYSPFIFRNNYRSGENYIQNVSNCIVLDFDDGFTRDEFKKTADFAYALGTTKSHMIDKKGLICERFRVIIPTETAISLDSEGVSELMEELFIDYPQADTACKDTARAYSGFGGSEVEIIKGELFDWEEYIDRAEKRRDLKKWQLQQREKPELKHDGTKADWYRENWLGDAMYKTLKVDERMAGGRNNGLYTIARYLKEIDLTDSEIKEAIEWANTDNLPQMEVKQILRGLRISA